MSELASPGQLRAALLRWSLFLAPLLLVLGTLSGAMAGSGGGNPWFLGLEKPAIYPPPATFGIVWTVLYLLMGVALAMVVTARGAAGRGAGRSGPEGGGWATGHRVALSPTPVQTSRRRERRRHRP